MYDELPNTHSSSHSHILAKCFANILVVMSIFKRAKRVCEKEDELFRNNSGWKKCILKSIFMMHNEHHEKFTALLLTWVISDLFRSTSCSQSKSQSQGVCSKKLFWNGGQMCRLASLARCLITPLCLFLALEVRMVEVAYAEETGGNYPVLVVL